MSNAGRRRSSLSPTKKAEKKGEEEETEEDTCMHASRKMHRSNTKTWSHWKRRRKKEKKEKKKVLEGITPCFFNLSAAGHTKK